MTFLQHELPHHNSTRECEKTAEDLRKAYKEFINALRTHEQLMRDLSSSQENLAGLVNVIKAMRSVHGAQRRLFLRLLCLYEMYGDWVHGAQIAKSTQVSRYNVVRYLTYNPRRKRSSTRGSSNIDILVGKEYRSETDEKGVVRRRLYLRPLSIFQTLGRLNYLYRKLIYQAADLEESIGKMHTEAISTIETEAMNWIIPWNRVIECEAAKIRILDIFRDLRVPREMVESVNAFVKSIKPEPKARDYYERSQSRSRPVAPELQVLCREIRNLTRSRLELLNSSALISSMHIFHVYRREQVVPTGALEDKKSVLPWSQRLSDMFRSMAQSLVEGLDEKMVETQLRSIGAEARKLGPDRKTEALQLFDEYLGQFLSKEDGKNRAWVAKTLESKRILLGQFDEYDFIVSERRRLEGAAVQILLRCGKDPRQYGLGS